MLVAFASKRKAIPPSRLDIDDLDAPLISSFLDHLERDRNNGPRTRNARLVAMRSLFRFAALRHPEHAATIERVLAIPAKRFERRLVTFLDEKELAALLAAPDRHSWTGRRDQVLLTLAAQSGMRVSEIINLQTGDVHLGVGAHVSCTGKGRKMRITPITAQMASLLKQWLRERGGLPTEILCVSRSSKSLSRDAIRASISEIRRYRQQSLSVAQAEKDHHACLAAQRRHAVDAGWDRAVCNRTLAWPSSRSAQPIYTCKLTWRLRSTPWRKRHRHLLSAAASNRATNCSASWRLYSRVAGCASDFKGRWRGTLPDYADVFAVMAAICRHLSLHVGIIRRSA